MLIIKIIIIQLFLLYFVPNQLLAEEKTHQNSQQNMGFSNNKFAQETATNQNNIKQEGSVLTQGELGAEIDISPLLTENQQHGQLYLSAFDPEHQLYPIKLIAIDGWTVTDEIVGKPILLAEGEHQLKVGPDFSNIHPQKLFMASDWPEKHIGFNLKNEEHLAVAARLKNKLTLQWKVEIYRIEAPVDELSAKSNLIYQEQ